MARALAILAAVLAVVLARAPAAEASYQPPRVGLENRVWGSEPDSAANATQVARQACECLEAFRLLRAATASGSVFFLQRDPSGYRDSVNLYAGFANDPVNNRDPTGRFIPLLIGACAANPVCAGAVIGAGVAAGAQLYDLFANGNVRSNGEIAEGLAIGAAAGVVGAGAGGVAAAGATRVGLGTVATGGVSGAAAGATGGSTARALSGEEVTAGTLLLDSSIGFGIGIAFGTASAISRAGDDIADDVARAFSEGVESFADEAARVAAPKGPRIFTSQTRWQAPRSGTGQSYRVYRQNIDWDLEVGGLTNLQRAQAGKAPYVMKNGAPQRLNLHHSRQDARGSLFELSEQTHLRTRTGLGREALHPYGRNKHPFFPVDRAAFGRDKSQYWIDRAAEL